VTTALPDPTGIFERAPELADLARADAAIAKAVARGDAHAAYRALWWARLRGRLAEHRPTVDALLAHRALFVSPLRRMPVLQTINGVGASVYGGSDRDRDGSYVKTHFLVVLFAPVFPLAQYLVKDADGGGWYFLGKVPMSTPVRIWNRLVVVGILAMVLAGALQAFHSSRYHDVHVVNGLPWTVQVAVGDVRYGVPAGQRRTESVHTGRHSVRVTSASGAPVESGELEVEAGTDVIVWNVLGAAPVYERSVVYETAKGGVRAPEPLFFCGAQSIRRAGVDYAFSEPPQSISMPKGQSVAYRRHVGLLPQAELDYCANELADKPEPALALARGIVALDAEGKHTALAVGLCRTVGKTDDALQLAQQALARHPDSVEHHRLYQSVAEDLGRTAELLQVYKARFDAAPGSADAAYLYARVLPDEDALPLATSFVQKFPDHVGLRRILVFRHMRERRFADALASIERIQALDREEWAYFLDDQLTALAALGRTDEARQLAEQAFSRKEGRLYQLAAFHAWLSGGKGPAADALLTRLAEGDAAERLALQVRFWTAPANASLAPLAGAPDKGLYALLQHAHYDPKAALQDLVAARAEDLSSLDLQVQLLLLGEAHLTHSDAARQRLEPVVQRYLPPGAVLAYLDQGTWDQSLEDLPLATQGALHLARSRKQGLSPRDREDLRALAHGCDPVGGYVRMALSHWPS
jgi:hypothetical protein